MKFSKVLAGIAAASIAAVSASAVAGAELVVSGAAKDANGMDLVFSSATSWMPIAYNNGERNETVLADKTKAIVDYGVDWSQAKSIEVAFHVTEDTRKDWAEENNFGGAIILSSNADGNSEHNWPAKEFYGVNDDALEFTAESAKELQVEKTGDYAYKVVCPIDDTNSVVPNQQMVQISFSDYAGAVWWQVQVDSMSVKDASGNTLISWDGATGACSLSPVGAAVEEAPAVEETAVPVEEAVPAAEETASVDAAAETAAPAPAAGDTAAATTSTKGSPNTGIEDVAVVAGIAAVAAGAFVVAKKRK